MKILHRQSKEDFLNDSYKLYVYFIAYLLKTNSMMEKAPAFLEVLLCYNIVHNVTYPSDKYY